MRLHSHAADVLHGGVPFDVHRRACPPHLLPLLDGSPVIEWHRVQAYQDVSLKLILQSVLQGLALKRGNDRVYLPREVTRERLRPLPDLPDGSFHLYCSRHNAGIFDFLPLLQRYNSNQSLSRRRSGSVLNAFRPKLRNNSTTADSERTLKLTSEPKQITSALHFLCYLNADTHASGSDTAQFHADLDRALQAGMHILLVHETRPEANGAPFKTIIDATPEELKCAWDSDHQLAEKRLYKELAVMICGSRRRGQDHLEVGLHLLLNAICAPSSHTISNVALDMEQVVVERELNGVQNVMFEDSEVGRETEVSNLDQSVALGPEGSTGWKCARKQLARGPLKLQNSLPDGSRKLCVRAALEHQQS